MCSYDIFIEAKIVPSENYAIESADSNATLSDNWTEVAQG